MKSHSDLISWAVILSATTSLVLMICLLQIDSIVHGTLYDYGLHFSYNWANPYWGLARIGFAAGWTNIIIAFAVQLNNIRVKRKAEQPLATIEKAWETAKNVRATLETETKESPEKGLKEHSETETETETAESPEEAPAMTPESEAQDKKEEPQQPEQAPEQEPPPQQPENKSEETPSLVDLFK